MVARLLVFFWMAGLAACSGSGDRLAADPRDPFEATNRESFAFDLKVDDIVLEPLAKGYRKLPEGVQTAATNFATWTSHPSTTVNSVLQGKLANAALATVHFLVNGLTLGMADLTANDDDPDDEDFGQTLAFLSVPQGPYIVMPLFGPGTARSHTGSLVDAVTDPLGQLGEPAAATIQIAATPVGVVTFRGNNLEAINDIKYNSADPYALTRSVWYQYREGQLRNGDADAPSAADEAFDSFLDGEEVQ